MITPAPKPRKRVRMKRRWDQTGFVAPKVERVKDPDHVRAVAGLPCCVCAFLVEKQRTKTEAHHTRSRGAFGGDDTVAPLCVRHHKLYHLIGRKSFKQRIGLDVAAVAKDLWKLRTQLGSVE